MITKETKAYVIESNVLKAWDNDLRAVRHANKMFSWIEELVTNQGDLT